MWTPWKKKEPTPPVDPVRAALEKGKCPDCGSKKFYEGPSGGLCTNWKCAGCGSRFNIGVVSGSIILADRI